MFRHLLISILTVATIHTTGFTAATTITNVPYQHGKVALEGRLIVPNPPIANLPIIVLFPDWMGVGKRPTDDGKRLAVKGYAVFVADVYGKTARPKNAEEAGKLAGALRADVMLLRERAAAALEAARRQPGVDPARVALLGFCFGGMAALELARSGAEVRGTATVHGNLKTPFPADARNIKGKVLVLHGAADPHVTPAEVEGFKAELDTAHVPLNFIAYEGAMHAFTNPKANDPGRGLMYHPEATDLAYGELEKFFGEVLAP